MTPVDVAGRTGSWGAWTSTPSCAASTVSSRRPRRSRRGVSEERVRWLVHTGRWTRICRGVYRAQTGELDWLGRAHALVARAGEGAALTLRTAAHLHGIEAAPPQVITLAVPPGRQVTRLPGTRVTRRLGLVVVTRRGLPVTAAAQTVLDLADLPGATWQDATAEAARWVHRGRTSADELHAGLTARSRHRHRRVLELALRPIAAGAQSLLEVMYVERVERRHGLPAARLQAPAVDDGAAVRRDAEYEEFAVVVEVDGRLFHDGASLYADRRRDRGAARSGRVTLRAGFVELEADPCALARDVAATLATRGWRGRARACGRPGCAVGRASRAA